MMATALPDPDLALVETMNDNQLVTEMRRVRYKRQNHFYRERMTRIAEEMLRRQKPSTLPSQADTSSCEIAQVCANCDPQTSPSEEVNPMK